MFTGIIEGCAEVVDIDDHSSQKSLMRLELDLGPSINYQELVIGQSIAVNGCCLTVADFSNRKNPIFEVSTETMNVTNFKALKISDHTNFERSLKVGDRLDGHMVSGHVDDVGLVQKLERLEGGWVLQVSIPFRWKDNVIYKGSAAINGISLTVNHVEHLANKAVVLSFMIIPTTVSKTNIRYLSVGALVNFEADMVGKYILAKYKT